MFVRVIVEVYCRVRKGRWTWFLYSKRKLRVVQFVLVGRAGRPDMSPVPDPLGNMHSPAHCHHRSPDEIKRAPFRSVFPENNRENRGL